MLRACSVGENLEKKILTFELRRITGDKHLLRNIDRRKRDADATDYLYNNTVAYKTCAIILALRIDNIRSW